MFFKVLNEHIYVLQSLVKAVRLSEAVLPVSGGRKLSNLG